jgi:hypothetical protein
MKIFTLGITLLLLSCLNYANIIYVDDSNTSGIENGSLQYPFNTVTEGVNAAINGDTVYIFSGTYFVEETFPILLKAGLTLIGENRDFTVIQDSLELSVSSEPEPVSINNLTFDRIKISRRTPGSVPLLPNTIKNCIITGDVEIAYFGIHQFNLEGCKIIGGVGYVAARDSLNRTGEGYNTIDSCEIDSCFESAFIGNHRFRIKDSEIGSSVTFKCVVDSIFTDPDIIVTDNLIGDLFEIKATRTGSVVSGNIINNGVGFVISGYGKSQSILSNKITTSSDSVNGIAGMIVSAPTLIENNIITLPEKSIGIGVVSSDTVIVKGNIITGGRIGVDFLGSRGSMLGNTIAEADTGLRLKSSHLVCNENTVSNCSGVGIFSEGLGSFNYNHITNCGIGIIELAGDFFYNTISGCYGDGIISTVTGSFGHNKITNNQGAGIRIQNYADLGGGFYNSPGFNTLQNNGTYDVFVESTLDSIIYAKNNLWDHFTESEISEFDIYDYNDDTTLALIIFTPFLLTDVDEDNNEEIPTDFVLHQNYPNPFNPSTSIEYRVGSSEYVTLKVYDILGNEIATLVNEYKPAGEYEIEFNTSSIKHHTSSGVYFYQLKAMAYLETKKMLLIK